MTRENLEILHDSGAFNPSPRHQELLATHVPFDTMTGTRGCEQALASALRRSERVTLVGTSGAGKSPPPCTRWWRTWFRYPFRWRSSGRRWPGTRLRSSVIWCRW